MRIESTPTGQNGLYRRGTSLSLDNEVIEQIQRKAEAEGLAKSHIAERLIKKGLESEG